MSPVLLTIMVATAFTGSSGVPDFSSARALPAARIEAMIPLYALSARAAGVDDALRSTYDGKGTAESTMPLERIWRPLPCARSGDRMTC